MKKLDFNKPNKGLILLRASVFAMFIVLVVLLMVFILVKHKSRQSYERNFTQKKCDEGKEIKILSPIEEVKIDSKDLVILTEKNQKNLQEIIRIDAKCGTEINRIFFKISEDE